MGKTGSHKCGLNVSSLCLPWEQDPEHVFLKGGVQASHSPPVSPVHCLTSQKDTTPTHQIPGLECPVCRSHCSVPRVGVCLCIFSFSTAGDLSPTLLLFFPSYPIICTTFLHPGLYKSPSAIFQLVFFFSFMKLRIFYFTLFCFTILYRFCHTST